VKRKFTDEELFRLYSEGLNDREIARALNVSKSSVRARRVRLGLPPQPSVAKFKRKMSNEKLKILRELWDSRTATELARILGVDRTTVVSWAKRLGLKTHKPLKMNDEKLKILKDAWGSRSRAELAAMLGVSKKTVLNWARRLGLPTRQNTRRPVKVERKMSEEKLKILRDLWEEHSIGEIASMLGVHKRTVAKYARRLGLRKYLKVDPELIRRLRLEGLTYRQIASRLNTTIDIVRYHCLKMGLKVKKPTRVDIEEFKRLYGEGLKYGEIASRLGISKSHAQALRLKLGLPGRRRGRPRNRLKNTGIYGGLVEPTLS
jgi:DNA-directed RNA polymerase specialized sigma24 family protein